MKFYLPFWWPDGINTQFDPLNETSPHKEKVRIWNIYNPPPFDGILVSRVNVESKPPEQKDIHAALDFNGTIMGDCGAFSYINESEPPYDPIETLEFYEKYGFDIGVTVDHLIVPKYDHDKEYRQELTIKNAKKMFDVWKNKGTKLKLLGVVQGWDAISYATAALELAEYGFDYIALGGLVRESTKNIKKILENVHAILQTTSQEKGAQIKIHLFGIARESLFAKMKHTGVHSFDSAGSLRNAWLSAKKNYYLDNVPYCAIRIPRPKDLRGKKKKYVEEHSISKNDLKKLENSALANIRAFKKHNDSLDEALTALRNYTSAFTPEHEIHKILKEYQRTLKTRPWELCDCRICKEIGIDVIIFRMHERNMRRGFHNVYDFYKHFKKWEQEYASTQKPEKKNQLLKLIES
ncbi:MAG: tRNA-guanine transglycosylase DpdA [Promethearchaeota archaeon]